MVSVSVQSDDFDISSEIEKLRAGRHDIGAIVTFTGTVRDLDGTLESMTLEHYPGMTEAELERISTQAAERWPLMGCRVIHRYGTLKPGENIVLVITLSAHRKAAFEAAEFLMDYLKTDAPFWKKEKTATETKWVAAKEDDDAAKGRWKDNPPS